MPCITMVRLLAVLMIVFGLIAAGEVHAKSAADAQSDVRFSAERHLEGFEDASYSDFSHLYRLDYFSSFDGERMDSTRLAEIRAEWDRIRTEVRDKINRIENDPTERTLHLLERKLRRHNYFSKISVTRDQSHAPVVIYIQDLQKPHRDYRKEILDRYGPPLKRLVDVFNETYAGPLEFRPRKGSEAFVLFVLSSHGDYSNYLESASQRGVYTNGAYYDPDLRAGVTYENVFDRSQSKENPRRRAALFVTAHALLHAHRTYPDPPLGNGWLFDGIAETLSRAAEEGQEPQPDRISAKALRDLAAMIKKPVDRNIFFLRADDLLASHNQGVVYRLMQPRAEAHKRTGWWTGGIACYQKEAGVFVHFLRDGSGGAYRDMFFTYLRTAMTRNDAPPAKGFSFPEKDPDLLNARFVDHLVAQLEDRCPDRALTAAERESLLRRPAAAAGAPADKTAAGPPRPASRILDANFDPAVLSGGPLYPGIVFGLGLQEARRGRFEAAMKIVHGLTVTDLKDDDLKALIAREKGRLKDLVKLRESFLAAAVKDGFKVTVERSGQKIVGVIERVEDGSFTMQRSNGETVDFPAEALDPGQLLRNIRSRKLSLCDDRILAHAGILDGNRIWRKYARGEDPGTVALKEDADRLTEYLRESRVHDALRELARNPLPATPEEARTVLDSIRRLLDEHRDSAAVDGQAANLRQLAGHAAAVLFDDLDFGTAASALLHGKVETLPEGRVKLTYLFEDEAELEDFTAIEEYLPDWREKLDTLKATEEDSFFRIDRNRLNCYGIGCLRHKIGLEAPMTISYELVYSSSGISGIKDEMPGGYFLVGFCDDGFGSCAKCVGMGHLEAFDKESHFFEVSESEAGYYADTRYKIRIVHDGQKIDSTRDGKPFTSIPCGPFRSGGVFLYVCHDVVIRVYKLVLEGDPDPASLGGLRDEWIEKRLAELGL